MRPTSVARVGTSYACFDFFIQKSQSLAPLFLLFAKGHVQVGYSLVNALITPLFHYQPFASVPTAQEGHEVITRRGRLQPPPVTEKGSKKGWQRSKKSRIGVSPMIFFGNRNRAPWFKFHLRSHKKRAPDGTLFYLFTFGLFVLHNK